MGVLPVPAACVDGGVQHTTHVETNVCKAVTV